MKEKIIRKIDGIMFQNYFVFDKVPIFALFGQEILFPNENQTADLMRRSTIILTWNAAIEVDSNDQIKCFQFFCSYLLVTNSNHSNRKPFSHFKHKNKITWQDSKCENLAIFLD